VTTLARQEVSTINALATDASGGVYLTGATDQNPSAPDLCSAALDAAGNHLWTAIYEGGLNRANTGTAIAVDGVGQIYVAGNTYVLGQPGDLILLKYKLGSPRICRGSLRRRPIRKCGAGRMPFLLPPRPAQARCVTSGT
jgi:hypothetical protein